ncbi:unnamed protein product [Prorocentrum cordatum]|uniref:RING-type domain-containing protein n=1 Tax=Prorocentrum cordatum TaxID=2364126 RepID=A0ABN9RKV2_9DINO|nr:unnamed protein product [Polarella glacialis]
MVRCQVLASYVPGSWAGASASVPSTPPALLSTSQPPTPPEVLGRARTAPGTPPAALARAAAPSTPLDLAPRTSRDALVGAGAAGVSAPRSDGASSSDDSDESPTDSLFRHPPSDGSSEVAPEAAALFVPDSPPPSAGSAPEASGAASSSAPVAPQERRDRLDAEIAVSNLFVAAEEAHHRLDRERLRRPSPGGDGDGEEQTDRLRRNPPAGISSPTPLGLGDPLQGRVGRGAPEGAPRCAPAATRAAAGAAELGADGLCVVCMEMSADYLPVSCMHMCCCQGCAMEIQRQDNRCPICRFHVEEWKRVYLPSRAAEGGGPAGKGRGEKEKKDKKGKKRRHDKEDIEGSHRKRRREKRSEEEKDSNGADRERKRKKHKKMKKGQGEAEGDAWLDAAGRSRQKVAKLEAEMQLRVADMCPEDCAAALRQYCEQISEWLNPDSLPPGFLPSHLRELKAQLVEELRQLGAAAAQAPVAAAAARAPAGRAVPSAAAGAGDLRPGGRVRLEGVQCRPELNGLEGTLVSFLGEEGRWRVQLDGEAERSRLFLAANLAPVVGAPPGAERRAAPEGGAASPAAAVAASAARAPSVGASSAASPAARSAAGLGGAGGVVEEGYQEGGAALEALPRECSLCRSALEGPRFSAPKQTLTTRCTGVPRHVFDWWGGNWVKDRGGPALLRGRG